MGKKSRGKKDQSAKRERKAFDRLVSGLDDLASLDLIDVDEYGWPVGKNGQRLAASILTMLDEEAERAGWDQPHRIVTVIRPDVSAAMERDLLADGEIEYVEPSTNDPDKPKQMFVLGAEEFEGDVTQALWWYKSIPPTMAIAVQQEVFYAPTSDGTLRPSEHPDRQEIRAINLYTRSGREYSITRWRGEDVRLMAHEEESSLACLAFAALGAPIPPSWPRLSLQKFIENFIYADLIDYYDKALRPLVEGGSLDLEPDLADNLMHARACSTALHYFFALAKDKELTEDEAQAVEHLTQEMAQWRTGNQVAPLKLSKQAAKAEPVLRAVITSSTWEEALRIADFHELPFVAKVAPEVELAQRIWNNEDFFEALVACNYPEATLSPFDVEPTWANVRMVLTKSLQQMPPEIRPALKDASTAYTQ